MGTENSRNSNAKFVKFAFSILLFQAFTALSAPASEISSSGRTDVWDNPFIAFEFNRQTDLVNGYLAALRASPSQTNKCKLVFSGILAKSKVLSLKYLSEADGSAKFRNVNSGPSVHESANEVSVSLGHPSVGKFVGVYVIRSPKGKFYTAPDASTVQKSFLVEADLI